MVDVAEECSVQDSVVVWVALEVEVDSDEHGTGDIIDPVVAECGGDETDI